MSDSVRPHRWQPTRLHCPWDSPGKNTGVGCHFLLQCVKVKTESEVTESCPTLSDCMDCSPLGSSVHGIFPRLSILKKKKLGFPGGSVVKNPAANAGDMGLIPGSGRSPKEGNGNPLQYSCLENPMDGGAWWATVQGSQRVGHD